MKCIAIIILTLAIIGVSMNSLNANEYDFPDPAFKELLLKEVDKPSGELTSEDISKISKKGDLYIQGQNIKSIEGIQIFSSLRSVCISETQVTDLSPLADLNNLESLELVNTNIEDFSHMPDLLNLKRLFIITDREMDIGSLSKLKNLNFLNITFKEMNIFDIPEEDDLNKVMPLDLNQVSKLTELEVIILEYPKLANYNSLAKLKKLRWIKLSSDDPIDLAFVSEMKRLERIDLSNPSICDLTPLSGLVNLEKITIKRNSLKDVSPLLNMMNLKEVSIVLNEDSSDKISNQLAILNNKGIKTKKTFLDSPCTLTLLCLAISQKHFRDKNPDNNYGEWDELVESEYIKATWTRETIAEAYNIVIFDITPSEKNEEGEITKESTFRIVAVPKVQSNELNIFAIDESQVLKVWIGNESEWDINGIDLNNLDLWEPI